MSQFDSIIKACSYLLDSSPQAEECRSYLNKRLSSEMQKQFGFGYFPANLGELFSFVSEEELKNLSLMYSKEIADSGGTHSLSFGFFQDHPLIMPYRNVYGDIIAIVGRSLLSDEERSKAKVSKYKNTHFVKGNHIFGLYEAKEAIIEAGFVYVVEGQFDMIKAAEKGLKNVIAIGSADLSSYQLSIISRYTNNILLLLDSDEAGIRGRERAISKYGELINMQGVFLPAGYKDLDSYLSVHSVESMELVVRDVQLDW